MPEEGAGEKTEDATPRRREKEREQGRVAKSRDLAAAIILLGIVIFLRFGAGAMLEYFMAAMHRYLWFEMRSSLPPTGVEVMPDAYLWLKLIFYCLAPFLVTIFLLALAGNILQTGFMFSPQAIKLDLNKINPINGAKRMVSLRSLVMLLLNAAKLVVVVLLVWYTISAQIPLTAALTRVGVFPMMSHSALAVWDLALKLSVLFFLLGLADYGYQLYQYNQDIKMTKQEVKEEMKDMEGDPHIKSRRRQIQREIAMQRMMQEVPEAEVVIRNPTHFAVALKIDETAGVPMVIAKGMDKVALKIVALATQSGVLVWQDPPLCRQLFNSVEVGEPIPPALYAAVAELLGYIYQNNEAKRREYAERFGLAS